MTDKNDNVKSALKLSFKKLDSPQPTLIKLSPTKQIQSTLGAHNFSSLYCSKINDQNYFLLKGQGNNETFQLPNINLNKSAPRQRIEKRRLSGNILIRGKIRRSCC